MNNVIIPLALSSVQERDHLVWDKVAQKSVILKRGTYKASEYDTARYTTPHSQVMCVREGKVLCAPLGNAGTAMWAQSSYYKITGLTYPATLNVQLYKAQSGTTIVTQTVADNDAASLAAAIKAVDSYIIKAEVLDDGIGVQVNSYNTSDMSNAIYGRMRFRITGDDAVKVDSQTVSVGGVTLHMMDEYVYQCQSQKDIIRLKGIALPPYQSYPWRLDGSAGSPGFHLDKMVQYYSTSGGASFSPTSTMKREVFDGLADSTNAAERAYWHKYGGDYETYIARTLMDIDDVRGSNAIYRDNAEFTRVVGSLMTLDYNGNEVAAYPAVAKCLAYGYDDPVHAVGNWLGTDSRLISLIMRRTGLTSSNKTEWDKEIILVGGIPTYAATNYWLPCCEYYAGIGVIYYGTAGVWASNAKSGSNYVLPFLAYNPNI